MRRFHLSGPARADIARILAMSAARWGSDARQRYAALLVSALRQVARDPEGPLTRDRAECGAGLRSIHLRHARADDLTRVRSPVHIVYFRVTAQQHIEIARVLHERMDPSLHVRIDHRTGQPE